MKKYFDFNEVRWFGFTNILSAFNKSKKARAWLTKVDNFLSKTPLRYFFWQFAGVAKKK